MKPLKVTREQILNFCAMYPLLMSQCNIIHQEYLVALRTRDSRIFRPAAKRYRTHPLNKTLSACIVLHFPYSPATMATGDTISRFLKVFRQNYKP